MNERIRQLADQALFESDFDDEQNIKITMDIFAELIVRECGYYADVFESLGCPVDMDPTETKPSDYIKREMGITE